VHTAAGTARLSYLFSAQARSGSCGWDARVRRCVILPPHKEPCLLAGKGQSVQSIKGMLFSDKQTAAEEDGPQRSRV
jgi:hypothetical protein